MIRGVGSYEKSRVGKGVLFRKLKTVAICSIFLVVTTFNSYYIVEGNYALKKQTPIILEEGEHGGIFCIQNGFMYLGVQNTAQTEDFISMQIVDVREPENPTRLGKYELDTSEHILKMEVKEKIAYLLRVKSYLGVGNWTVTLLNVTEPANPVQLASTVVENVTHPAWDMWDLAIHNNYLYVSTDSSVEIFDCSNLTSPMKVANYTSLIGDIYINNNYLYLVCGGVSIYDSTNSTSPVLIGKVNGTKHTRAGSGIFGNYIISAFWWSGLQVYNCTNPVQPTICGNYEFPQRETYPGGQIHAMEIQGEKLFVAGRKVYVFDLSNLQDIKRIARKTMGERDAYGIALSGNYIYTTTYHAIKVFLFEENSLWRNVGLGIGLGILLPVAVIVTLRIRSQKRKT